MGRPSPEGHHRDPLSLAAPRHLRSGLRECNQRFRSDLDHALDLPMQSLASEGILEQADESLAEQRGRFAGVRRSNGEILVTNKLLAPLSSIWGAPPDLSSILVSPSESHLSSRFVL